MHGQKKTSNSSLSFWVFFILVTNQLIKVKVMGLKGLSSSLMKIGFYHSLII